MQHFYCKQFSQKYLFLFVCVFLCFGFCVVFLYSLVPVQETPVVPAVCVSLFCSAINFLVVLHVFESDKVFLYDFKVLSLHLIQW